MLPPHHLLATVALALPLRARGWTSAAIAGLLVGGVLVDGDHYLSYVWHTGDLSIRRAYAFHRAAYRSPFGWNLHPRWPTLEVQRYRELHSFAAIGATFVLSLLAGRATPMVRAIAIGLAFHRALDELSGWVHPPASGGDDD
ncbi:MAG: hypothetical protein ACKO2D_07475 [Chloroflexota bacterium]